MNNHINFKLFLLGISMLFLFFAGCKGDKIEDINLIPDVSSRSRSGSCDLVISGRVMDTQNLKPLKDAILSSDLFVTETDKDGNFRVTVKVSAIQDLDFLTVTRFGYLPQTIPIFYDSVLDLEECPDITNIDWKIGLSKRKECLPIGKEEGAWYKIMDTVANEVINELGLLDTIYRSTIYDVDVRRKSINEYVNLCISPDNSFAYGLGILVNHNLFRLANFVIEDADNPGNKVNLLKPLEIIFSSPNPDYTFGKKFPVLNLDNIIIDEIGVASVTSNDNILLRVNSFGNAYIGTSQEVIKLCQELLEALRMRDKELIDSVIEKIRRSPNAPTRISTEELKIGNVVKEETFSNCECGQPTIATYTVQFNGQEELHIDFPPGTSKALQAEVFTKLRTLLADSGKSFLTASLTVGLDQCEEVDVFSRPIIECTIGLIDGYSFTYEATKKLETILVGSDRCPTESGCHQGCSG